MDTLIFLTTQTSATDSILRVICKISGEDFLQAKYIDKYLQNKPMKELLNEELPYNGGLHRFNLPPFFPVSKTYDRNAYQDTRYLTQTNLNIAIENDQRLCENRGNTDDQAFTNARLET